MSNYLQATQEAAVALIRKGIVGPVFMLNLLRFRKTADYLAAPELAPGSPISGSEAYDRYMVHTLPYLIESGGEVIFFGRGDAFLIGPEEERWDRVMLVKQRSVEAFIAFVRNEAYLEGIGHRTAALEDSRLLPLTELALPMGLLGSNQA